MASQEEYTFLGEVDDRLKCLICLNPARNPQQHKCGRLFCERCVGRVGRGEPCPNCREVADYFEDVRSKYVHVCLYVNSS